VTVIQRFGGGLNLNVHFHTLLFDGVFFADGASGALDFRPLPPPTDEEVGVVLARIATRVQRLLKRRGLDPGDADMCRADPVVEEFPVLAGISSASIQGRAALGPRAGARVWRVGADPDAPWLFSTAPRHAHLAGFDLHANVDTPASDRKRLEQLCRYLLRPAVAQDRLRFLDDGRIVLTLKAAWADGTRQLVFEPLELLRGARLPGDRRRAAAPGRALIDRDIPRPRPDRARPSPPARRRSCGPGAAPPRAPPRPSARAPRARSR
jgi:hypothetical protein